MKKGIMLAKYFETPHCLTSINNEVTYVGNLDFFAIIPFKELYFIILTIRLF